MTNDLKDFYEALTSLVEETGVLKNPEGKIGSHNLKGSVSIIVDDDDIDVDFEVIGLEQAYLPGCMCPSGVDIIIKKRNWN